MRCILDTNVLLRFLVGDVPAQKQQAAAWFKEAESGKRMIIISPIVIAETVFVLESFYHQKRSQIADALELVVAQPWLEVIERATLISLWKWYRRGLHFVDSFLVAWTETTNGVVLSFDQQLQTAVTQKNKSTIPRGSAAGFP